MKIRSLLALFFTCITQGIAAISLTIVVNEDYSEIYCKAIGSQLGLIQSKSGVDKFYDELVIDIRPDCNKVSLRHGSHADQHAEVASNKTSLLVREIKKAISSVIPLKNGTESSMDAYYTCIKTHPEKSYKSGTNDYTKYVIKQVEKNKKYIKLYNLIADIVQQSINNAGAGHYDCTIIHLERRFDWSHFKWKVGQRA